MRKRTTQFMRRGMAVFLSVAMAFSLLVAGPQEAEAGIAPASMTSALSKVALSAVKGSIAWGLGELADVTPNDTTANVFSTTRALIVGKKRVLAEQTIEMMEELTAELDALYNYTVTSTQDIEKLIKNLEQNETKDEFQTHAGTPVDTFTNRYKLIVDDFNKLMLAFSAYNEDPSDSNRDNLEQDYNAIYNTYFNGKDYDDLVTQINDMFINPLLVSIGDDASPGFLSLISPYDLTEDVNDSDDLTNPDSGSWVMRSGASVETTYLGYYRNYVNQITNFQNNAYDSMSDAATLVNNAAYLYLQAYRYFCEFQAVLFASDSSLSEEDVRSQTSVMWNDYYENVLKTIRAINQMYYTQEDVFTTYMRTSDVAKTRSIQDFKNPCAFNQMLKDYEAANGYDGIRYMEHAGVDYHTPTTSQSLKDFQEDQHIYQFRLVSDPSNVYAIRTSAGMDEQGNPIAEHDGISQAFPVRDMVTVMPGGGLQDQTGPSFDLLTSLKGLEGGFIAPVEMKELSAIADASITSYDTGDTLVGNIESELSMAFGGKDNVHLPEIEFHQLSNDEDDIKYGPNIMPLRRTVYWTMDYSIFEHPDARMTLGNASMPYSTGNEGFYDLEDNLRDYTGYEDDKHLQNSEAVVMWYCKNPSSSVTLSGSEGGTTSLKVGDSTLGSGQSGTFDSGTAMTIQAEPQDGYTISSVQLVDGGGNVLEDLLSNVTNEDGTTAITTQEILQVTSPNAGNAYEFLVPVPCQDATVKVDYVPVDESLLQYDVTLNDVEGDSGYDAVMQFGSYDFLSKKSYNEGDEVVVSVVGYNHNMAKGIKIADANGVLDVAVEDVTSDMKRTRPTERLYAFKMPKEDVQVTPILSTTNSVTVEDSANVTHAFENLDLYSVGNETTDWSHADELDFLEGDQITISYTLPSGDLLTSIEVFDSAKNILPVTPTDGTISFTMPARNVTVRFHEEGIDLYKYIVTLDSTGMEVPLQFINEHGDGLNLVKKQFNEGDTVNVRVTMPDGDALDQMVLTGADGTDNIFEAQEGTFDAKTGIATFKMPSVDATLSVKLREKPQITLDTSIDGATFQFVDEDGNVLDGTQRGFAPGETVRVKFETSELLSFKQMVLTQDGTTDNLFEAQGGTYDAETGIATFAMTEENATLSADFDKLTPEEVDGFETDDEGRIRIHTYEDLVKFAEVIRSNPEYYSVKDIVLTGNINANGKHWWTQGIGSFEDGIYYNGTFDGNGYCIFGMDIHIEECGSLFEVVGENGVVKNLFMFDCDSIYKADETGGIADVNLGRIEYCVNGINPKNVVNVQTETGELASIEEYNSLVQARYAGGIVSENHGTIYACRSAAEVQGSYYSGGIAALNRGVVSNCVGNGSVTSSLPYDEYHYGAGGLCGKNDTSIEGGYSSATVEAADGAGSISGVAYGDTVDTYYTTSDDQQMNGYASGNTETNVNGLELDAMAADSFVDQLNGTESNSVTWFRHTSLNAGLPVITNPSTSFGDMVLSSNGVTVKANMHRSALIDFTSLNNVSAPWKLLAEEADDGYTPSFVYACTIKDASGNKIPNELWVQSDQTFIVPVKSADTAVNVLHSDGSIERVESVDVAEVNDGYVATFTSDGVEAFMALQKDGSSDDDGSGGSSSGGSSSGTNTSGTSSSGTKASGTSTTGTSGSKTATASTGDYSVPMPVVVALVLAAACVLFVGIRKRDAK